MGGRTAVFVALGGLVLASAGLRGSSSRSLTLGERETLDLLEELGFNTAHPIGNVLGNARAVKHALDLYPHRDRLIRALARRFDPFGPDGGIPLRGSGAFLNEEGSKLDLEP